MHVLRLAAPLTRSAWHGSSGTATASSPPRNARTATGLRPATSRARDGRARAGARAGGLLAAQQARAVGIAAAPT
jgi:hypothetical protein